MNILYAAGNMALRLHFIKYMTQILDCSVFILSYRGYGLSGGVPSERGLQLDAEAAIEALLSRNDVDPNKIVVFGRSLGGAVAIYTASKHKEKIKGLIVRAREFPNFVVYTPCYFSEFVLLRC